MAERPTLNCLPNSASFGSFCPGWRLPSRISRWMARATFSKKRSFLSGVNAWATVPPSGAGGRSGAVGDDLPRPVRVEFPLDGNRQNSLSSYRQTFANVNVGAARGRARTARGCGRRTDPSPFCSWAPQPLAMGVPCEGGFLPSRDRGALAGRVCVPSRKPSSAPRWRTSPTLAVLPAQARRGRPAPRGRLDSRRAPASAVHHQGGAARQPAGRPAARQPRGRAARARPSACTRRPAPPAAPASWASPATTPQVWTELTARSLWTQRIRPDDVVLHCAGLTLFVGGLPVKDATRAPGRHLRAHRHRGVREGGHGPAGAQGQRAAQHPLVRDLPGRVRAQQLRHGPARAGTGAHHRRRRARGRHPGRAAAHRGRVGRVADRGHGQRRHGPHHLRGVRPSRAACTSTPRSSSSPRSSTPTAASRWRSNQGSPGSSSTRPSTASAARCCASAPGTASWFRTTECACGRTSFRIRCVGRTDDMLIVLGVNVFPSAIKDIICELTPETTGEMQIVLAAARTQGGAAHAHHRRVRQRRHRPGRAQGPRSRSWSRSG